MESGATVGKAEAPPGAVASRGGAAGGEHAVKKKATMAGPASHRRP
jgi:hypothetical protein